MTANQQNQRFLVGRGELARLMGVYPDRVTKFVAEGMPVAKTDSRSRAVGFDAVACLAWWRERHGGSSDDAKARRDRANAEWTELRILERRRELLDRAVVIRDGQATLLAVRSHLLKLPKRLLLAGVIAREGEAAVTALVRQALTELSSWRTLKDLQKAGKP